MRMEEVIIRPLVTERASKAMDKGIMVLKVHNLASKIEIKQAVEKMMGNKVESVRTLCVAGKKKRVLKSKRTVQLSNWKKAFVRIVKEPEIKAPDVKSIKAKLPGRRGTKKQEAK